MSVDWHDYEVFEPGVEQPLHAVSREDARAYFRRLMAEKAQRLEMLDRLVGRAGVSLDGTEASLDHLEEWFVSNVELDPNQANELRGRWLSVSQDIALYLAEMILRDASHLRWELDAGSRSNMSYQRPVLVGFRNVVRGQKIDLTFAISQYGLEVIEDPTTARGRFVAMTRSAIELA